MKVMPLYVLETSSQVCVGCTVKPILYCNISIEYYANPIFLFSEVFTVVVISEEGGPVRNISPAKLSMLLWKSIVSGSCPPADVSDTLLSLF